MIIISNVAYMQVNSWGQLIDSAIIYNILLISFLAKNHA